MLIHLLINLLLPSQPHPSKGSIPTFIIYNKNGSYRIVHIIVIKQRLQILNVWLPIIIFHVFYLNTMYCPTYNEVELKQVLII